VLTRVDSRGHGQPIAANLTQLVVVIAAEPSIDWLVLDHYLAAAELTKLSPLIVFNKTDIVAQLPAELEIYRRLAPFIATSALEGGLPPSLLEHLAGNRSVLVGQSGVGKSSLLNALFGATLQSVGELSARIRQGRHTTTGSALHRLKNGGELIDSPGVRRYAPWIEHERMVAGGFGEFQPFVARCRFADCSHLNEPNCAVKAAVGSGDIAQRRYASYGNLYELVAQLRTRREN
jgi:ribosome biogenesis GTPase